MKLNLSNTIDLNKFEIRSAALIEKGAKVELREIRPTRSLSQNNYLHVVITLYAMAYGCTLNEAKTDLKREHGLFYSKNGNKYLISSADLDTKQMTTFIEWIRNKASRDLNEYIPSSEEYLINKFNIDKDIERNKQYL